MAILVLPRTLDAAVEKLPDIGPTNAKRLEKLGISTIRDLLLALPFGWQSYGEPTPIASLEEGSPATVVGIVKTINPKQSLRRRIKLTEATIVDDSGSSLRLVWFNMPFVAKQLHKGDRIAVAGAVKLSRYSGLNMQNPHYERLDGVEDMQPARVGGMMPKYHLVDGLSSRKIARWVESALPLAGQLEDLLPVEVRERHHLLDVGDAVRRGHKPDNDEEYKQARRRMAFAELFELQAAFALMRANIALEPATPIRYRQEVIDAFKVGLGFELTTAQRKAIWDAYRDMEGTVPMNRLLNGDVGSGKTAVAAACVAMAHASGLQSVVMAPTEILARQHLRRFRAYLEDSLPGLTVELLVSSQSTAERRRVLAAAASGHCALVVGTHSLIEENVQFADLGLAIVDEQHIGRTPVATEVVPPGERDRAHELVRNQVRLGRQAFVICPLIEESEKVVARSATAEFERLGKDVFPDLKLDLMYGRLRDKDDVMKRFVAGETQVLVATAVVEVGVDVPNATVMMVEGADRFGLAQLHQFRGRVGRGAAESHCLLLADDPSAASLERLKLVETISDGFR